MSYFHIFLLSWYVCQFLYRVRRNLTPKYEETFIDYRFTRVIMNNITHYWCDKMLQRSYSNWNKIAAWTRLRSAEYSENNVRLCAIVCLNHPGIKYNSTPECSVDMRQTFSFVRRWWAPCGWCRCCAGGSSCCQWGLESSSSSPPGSADAPAQLETSNLSS